MVTVRQAAQRGHFNHGWLDTWHSFSFGTYTHPEYMQFRALRVLNEDYVQPGRGFAAHSHKDMEIISYVLEGAIEHKDSMGNSGILRPGSIQVMTAGSGIRHSEFNHSGDHPLHFIQMWIIPQQIDLEPAYSQLDISPEKGLTLLCSPDGEQGAARLNQDARIFLARPEPGDVIEYHPDLGRGVWIQVCRGSFLLNDTSLQAGDGAAVEQEEAFTLVSPTGGEVLLIDLP